MTTLTPVTVRRVAESLARISDNDDGFKPAVADTIETDLRRMAGTAGLDPDAMDPGDARELQKQWLEQLAEALA